VLSAYPILFLLSRNVIIIPIEQSFRSLVLSVGIAIAFISGFQLILKDWEKAGAICSLLIIMFFSFGHFANALGNWSIKDILILDISGLAWLWLFAFLLFTFMIIRSTLPEYFTGLLNIISSAIVISSLVLIISAVVPIKQDGHQVVEALSQSRRETETESPLLELSESELPDVYYIVLDAYERADKLEEFYNYDNSYFVQSLEDRGFYVASSSRSNYLNTDYSLNTSLNLVYVHDLPIRLFVRTKYNLLTNHVSDFLRKQGYQIVVFQSGTGDTDTQYKDIFVSSPSIQTREKPVINPFEQLLIRTTMGIMLFKQEPQHENSKQAGDAFSSSVNRELSIRRERVNYALDHLPDYASRDGHYFLFAHIYLPHIPFLFGPDGEALKYHGNLNINWYQTAPENYIEYYTYQITYLNKAVLASIDAILEKSEKPVVIILQSDHGDDKFLDWGAPTAQGVDIRSANLSAIYFSDGSYGSLYPTMTPVNTFRIIFNHWFATRYPLLPDKVFFHEFPTSTPPNAKPDFIDSCIKFNICLPYPHSLP
jgi:hypothetical protein